MSEAISAAVFEELEFLRKLEGLPVKSQAWMALRTVLRVLPLAWTEPDPLLEENAGGYARDVMAGMLACWVYTVEGFEQVLGEAEAAVMACATLPRKYHVPRPEYSMQVLECVEDLIGSLVWSRSSERGTDRSSSVVDSPVSVIAKAQQAAAEAEAALAMKGLVQALARASEEDYKMVAGSGGAPGAPLWRTDYPREFNPLQARQQRFLRQLDFGRVHAILDHLYAGVVVVKAIQDWLAAWKPGVNGMSPSPQQEAGKPADDGGLVATSALTATMSESLAEKDHLNRRKLIESLSRLLTEREDVQAFAIGLFGHWGSGKSSLLHLLEKKLREDAASGKGSSGPVIKIATFNAWRNEKSDKLAAMLAQSVVDRLVQDLGPWRRLMTALRLAARRQQGIDLAAGQMKRAVAWLAQWGPLAVPILVPFLVLGMALLWLPENGIRNWLTGVIASVGILLTAGRRLVQDQLTGWFRGLGVEKPWSLLKLPDYGEHRGLLVDIHRTLQHLCSLCLAGGTDPKRGEYLLLVVDDLDRCTVQTVKEVFDAVRLVADIPRVVTLVAIDERMAFAAVEQHYQQFSYAGREPALVARDYLAKVLQVSVILPEVEDNALDSFIDATLFKTAILGEPPAQPVAPGKMTAPPASDGGRDMRGAAEALGGKEMPPGNPPDGAGPGNIGPLPKGPAARPDPTTPMVAALPDERELFKDLARKFDFNNPRLLWRLYMAWKLLKSLTLEDGYRMEDAETGMRLLFWCEWVLQQEAAKRPAFEKWLGTGRPGERVDGLSDDIAEAMSPLRLRDPSGVKPSKFTPMKAVLLPTSSGSNVAKSGASS